MSATSGLASHSLADCTVYFRAEAGGAHGFGHVGRCLVLAEEVRRRGAATAFLSASLRPGWAEGIGTRHEILALPSSFGEVGDRDATATQAADGAASIRILDQTRSEPTRRWVVVDNYDLGETWERAVASRCHALLAVDDFRERGHYADLLLGEAPVPFPPAMNGMRGGQSLVGLDFAVIDAAYRSARESRAEPSGKPSLLVTYGATDSTDETAKALWALAAGSPPLWSCFGRIVVVVGRFNDRLDSYERLASGLENVTLRTGFTTLVRPITEADVILTAGGNTMLEALTAGTPCVVTVAADNQVPMVEELLGSPGVWRIGSAPAVSPGNVNEILSDVVDALPSATKELRDAPPVDGRGAERVADAMAALCASSLRKA